MMEKEDGGGASARDGNGDEMTTTAGDGKHGGSIGEGGGGGGGDMEASTMPVAEPVEVDLTGKKVLVVPADTVLGAELCSELKALGAEVVGASVGSQSDLFASAMPTPTRMLPAKLKLPADVDASVSDVESITDAAKTCDGVIVSLRDNESLTHALLATLIGDTNADACETENASTAITPPPALIAFTNPMTWARASQEQLADVPSSTGAASVCRPLEACASGWRKTLEAEFNVLRSSCAKLRTHVICPGLMYGCGELDSGFHAVFRAAWEGFPIKSLGTGMNVLPTVHVKDLARVAANAVGAGETAGCPPLPPYIFTTDHMLSRQGQIFEAISAGIATNTAAQPLDILDLALPTPAARAQGSGPAPQGTSCIDSSALAHLFLNLELTRTSHPLVDPPATMTSESSSSSATGPLHERIAPVVDEFIDSRRLAPLRILILSSPDNEEVPVPAGTSAASATTTTTTIEKPSTPASAPPALSKSQKFAMSLSAYYNIPVARRGDIVEWGGTNRMQARIKARALERQKRIADEAREKELAAAAAALSAESGGDGSDTADGEKDAQEKEDEEEGSAPVAAVAAAAAAAVSAASGGDGGEGNADDAEEENELEPEDLSFGERFAYASDLNDVLKNHGSIMLNVFENVNEAMNVLTREQVVPASSDDATKSGDQQTENRTDTVPNEKHFPTLCIVIDSEFSQTSVVTKAASSGGASTGGGKKKEDAAQSSATTDEQKAERLGMTKDEYAKATAQFKALVRGTAEDGSDSLPAKLASFGANVITMDSPRTVKELATIVKRTMGKPRNYILAGGQNSVAFADTSTTMFPVVGAGVRQAVSTPQPPGPATTPCVGEGSGRGGGNYGAFSGTPPTSSKRGASTPGESTTDFPFSSLSVSDAEVLLRLHEELSASMPAAQRKPTPLSRYLNQNIMPALLEGMLKVCHDRPSDPIEVLARFLESKSAAASSLNPSPPTSPVAADAPTVAE